MLADSEEMRVAIRRGLAVVYPEPGDVDNEFSGHVLNIIDAIRAAVAPLI